MASSTVDRETLLQNMRAAVSTLTSGLANWSIDDMLAPRAENCEHEILPKSMGIPPSTNQQFREFFEGNMRDVMSDVKVRLTLPMPAIHPCHRSSGVLMSV